MIWTCEQSLMSLLPWVRLPTALIMAALSLGVLEIPLSKAVLLTGSPSQERGICLGKGLSTIQGHLCLFSLFVAFAGS